jgi:hypothetical protein
MKPFLGILSLLAILFVGTKISHGKMNLFNRKLSTCNDLDSKPKQHFPNDMDVFTPNIIHQILIK